MSPLNWPLLGQEWTQTADGLIRCAHCDMPSEQLVYRTLTVQEEQGRMTQTIRQSGPLCPTCAAQEARETL